VVDAAIAWINQQPKGQPWMASMAFATAHTPVMQPPSQLNRSSPVGFDDQIVGLGRGSPRGPFLTAPAKFQTEIKRRNPSDVTRTRRSLVP
jgi:hypothetical protein